MALMRCANGQGSGGSVECTFQKIVLTANVEESIEIQNGDYIISSSDAGSKTIYGYILNGVDTPLATNQYVTKSYAGGVLKVKISLSGYYLYMFKVN